MYEKTFPNKRFKLTLAFLKKHIATSETIFDLGVSNPFSKIMIENEYTVINTNGEDIDNDQSALNTEDYTVFTAFEIFEHLLNPYTVLENVKCDKVLISIPMRLWFASAYRSKTDKWDRHYHEFEDWQLDWLLEKTGFRIVDSIQFTHPVKKLGFRPLLRFFTPRYYLVYAVREKRE
ncbi:methyltransferase [Flavobacterium sp.]|uniref:methyltransferase n=1 Tax=Flavobacterium sp. TaxID=239 RepID=UPI004048618C